MKYRKLRMLLLIVLICLAFVFAAYALQPFIYGVEKSIEVGKAVEEFRETVQTVQPKTEQAEPDEAPEPTEPKVIPYAELWEDMLRYNRDLVIYNQRELDSKSAYERSQFRLTDYGLPSETFGVITIPKMELEMPLFLGASEANMADGAAVLSQTSIPIGGIGTNAVIAGHRGYGGYKYFKDIELLEVGDEVTITNLWETLIYRVAEIKIVSPNDVEAILIQPQRDLITLLTCHPYASGGKYRYLVFCERVHTE